MKGMKFLFKMGFRHIVLNIISVVLIAAIMVVMVLAHESVGAEDYFICKATLHFFAMIGVMMNFIFLSGDITGNRLMLSAPLSKQLKCTSIPTYCCLLGGGSTVLMNAFYAILCIASGLDMSNLSDMLIISAPIALCMIIMGVISLNVNYGMIFGIYTVFPLMGFCMLVPSDVWKNGFGLPLWAGALIFVGTLAVSIAAAFMLGRVFHAKTDFKPMAQVEQMYAK